MPLCFAASLSVRTKATHQSACWAPLVHNFWPLITHLSPLSSAWVRSPARSDPAPGSEKPWHHWISPFSIGGRNRRFCSSVP